MLHFIWTLRALGLYSPCLLYLSSIMHNVSVTHTHIRTILSVHSLWAASAIIHTIYWISYPEWPTAPCWNQPDTNHVEWVSSCRLNEDSGGHIVRAPYEVGAVLIERNESCRVPPGGSLADRDEVDGLLWSAVVCFKSSSDWKQTSWVCRLHCHNTANHKLRKQRPELPSPLMLTLSDKDDLVQVVDWCFSGLVLWPLVIWF